MCCVCWWGHLQSDTSRNSSSNITCVIKVSQRLSTPHNTRIALFLLTDINLLLLHRYNGHNLNNVNLGLVQGPPLVAPGNIYVGISNYGFVKWRNDAIVWRSFAMISNFLGNAAFGHLEGLVFFFVGEFPSWLSWLMFLAVVNRKLRSLQYLRAAT